jgi:predicted transcriptional regulator
MDMKRLGMFELESQVLEVLWEAGKPLSPRHVQERLPGPRKLAYTTVMTVLVRLWNKGVLDRDRKGRAFLYEPRLTRGEYAANKMRDILSSSRSRNDALASFVESIDPQDLASLRKLLAETERASPDSNRR